MVTVSSTYSPTSTPLNYNMGNINIGNQQPVNTPISSTLKDFNQQMVQGNKTPVITSNRTVIEDAKKIADKFNQQKNTSTVPPNISPASITTPSPTPTVNTTTGTTFAPPQGAVQQPDGTYQINGRYYTQDQLSTPESVAAIQNYGVDKKQQDEALQRQIDAIKQQYNQYRETQRQLTESGAAGARSALLQSGPGGRGSVAQYAAATADARVNTILEDGNKAIQDLGIKEQQLISAAEVAYRQDDYKMFNNLVSEIEKNRLAQVKKTTEINEKLAKEKEEADKIVKQSKTEQDILAIVSQGTTDPTQIMSQLKSQGKDIPLKTISDTVSLATGLGGTGIIAEYNYYKAEAKKAGITPVDFNTYQNEDANRKAVAQGLGGVGLTGIKYNPAQSKYIDTTNDKISKNPTYQTTNKMKTFIQNVQTALNQENGIGDIAAINQFQKIIDEGAVTRDQDVVLLQGAQSLASTLGLKIESLRKGDKLSNGQREQMKTLINEIYDAQIKALNNDPYVSTTKEALKRNGIAEEDTIIGELGGFSNKTTDSLLNAEKQAEADFASLVNNPPEIQTEITNRYKDLQTILGRPPTASEYFEANPWDRPKKSESVSTITDPAKGVVGGINLKGYAVDPNQIKSVATIYNKIPESGDALDFNMYIKSVAPKSKITGEDILEVANQYQLDPKAILALMQHESKIGTSSVALANNNFGGITWSESYARNNPGAMKGTPRPANEGGYYVKFATPLDGLMAQAKLLSNRKIG